MTDTTQTAWTPNTGQCFTCHGATENQTDAYCAACIAEQVRVQGDELAAFDAFHTYADTVARKG